MSLWRRRDSWRRHRRLSSCATLASGLTIAAAHGVTACKARTFHEASLAAPSASDADAATGQDGNAARKDVLQAGLSMVLPPAHDEAGLARLPSLRDVGFTPARFSSLLSATLGSVATPEERDAGDVFNPDAPSGVRTLTNETCLRTLEAWKLTHLQILPYERLVPGSYAAVADLEAQIDKRLVVPLVFRGTFQPWCVSRRTASKLQVFVLEQALQVEWRVLDLTPERQSLLVTQVNSTLASPQRAALKALAAAFETPERATTRAQAMADVATLARAWHGGLSPTLRDVALAPLLAHSRKAAQAGFGYRAEAPHAGALVHPGFARSPVHVEQVRAFLSRYARNVNLHVVYASLAESQRAPVFSVAAFEGDQARSARLRTKQALRVPSVPPAPDTLTLRPFLDLGRFTSATESGHDVLFDPADGITRGAFDRVDVDPALLKSFPVSETTKLRSRLKDVNAIHKSTTNCVYCHQLGGGRLLSGHTESEGPQLSALSLARAQADAPALLRELDALGTGSLDRKEEKK